MMYFDRSKGIRLYDVTYSFLFFSVLPLQLCIKIGDISFLLSPVKTILRNVLWLTDGVKYHMLPCLQAAYFFSYFVIMRVGRMKIIE